MSENDNTYQATLISDDGTETVELELIGGLPQKSFVRPVGDSAVADDAESDVDEVVWELVPGDDPETDGYQYRPGGIPGADYS